jgi:hypothetical protein
LVCTRRSWEIDWPSAFPGKVSAQQTPERCQFNRPARTVVTQREPIETGISCKVEKLPKRNKKKWETCSKVKVWSSGNGVEEDSCFWGGYDAVFIGYRRLGRAVTSLYTEVGSPRALSPRKDLYHLPIHMASYPKRSESKLVIISLFQEAEVVVRFQPCNRTYEVWLSIWLADNITLSV